MDVVRRRTICLIGTAPATIAGCLDLPTNDGGDVNGTDDSVPERVVTLDQVDDSPDHPYAEDVSVDVVDEVVDQSGPPHLRLSFTFGGDEPAGFEFPFFVRGAYSPAPSVDETPGLLLLPSDDYDRREGCWKRDRTRLSGSGEMPGYQFSPGETLTVDAFVWADHRYDECFEPGEYRFETTFTFDGETYRWGFTLGVSDPGGG